MDVEDTFTNRSAEGVDVGSELLLHISVADGTLVVESIEVLIDFGRGDNLHQSEEVLNRLRLLTVGLGRTSVRDGAHHLLGDGLLVVDEVDSIAFALAHLPRAIEARHLQSALAEGEGLGFGEEVHAVDGVEAAGELARHLHILLLVLPHGHLDSLMHQDVSGHQGGVSEQPCVDVVGLLACLVLEGSCTLQLPEVSIHIEIEVELEHLTHIALHVDGCLLGVNTTR